jgi:hypothetical protein
VIHKGERQVLAERYQPEAQLGQVHRKRVLVDAVQAALGDQAAGVEVFVDAGILGGLVFIAVVPGLHQPPRQETAHRDQERTRTHGRIAHLQRQDLFCRGLVVASLQPRPERLRHDRFGERPGRVMATAAASLGRGLQDQRARRQAVGGVGREAVAQRQAQLRQGGRLLEALLGLGRQLQRHAGLLIEPLLALAGGHLQQLLGIYHHGDRDLLPGRPVGDAHAGAAGPLHREAHDPLVHRADLLHIERAVIQSLGHLALIRQPQQPGEHLLHHLVADGWQVGEDVALV